MQKFQEIKFSGKVLQRGYWIYVIRITGQKKTYFYIGMTGDTSSVNAASLFSRLGRHLETRENTRGNSLFRAIEAESVLRGRYTELQYDVLGFRLRKEEKIAEEHKRVWREVSNIEETLAMDFNAWNYKVIGKHNKPRDPAHRQRQYREIILEIRATFGLDKLTVDNL